MNAGLTEEQREQILSELRNGRKIHAIKLYRLATGASLKESKEAVENMGVAKQPETSFAPPSPESIDAWRKAILADYGKGRKIQAIRSYREQTGASLQESRDAVERMSEEAFRSSNQENQVSSTHPHVQKSGCASALAVGALIAIVARLTATLLA